MFQDKINRTALQESGQALQATQSVVQSPLPPFSLNSLQGINFTNIPTQATGPDIVQHSPTDDNTSIGTDSKYIMHMPKSTAKNSARPVAKTQIEKKHQCPISGCKSTFRFIPEIDRGIQEFHSDDNTEEVRKAKEQWQKDKSDKSERRKAARERMKLKRRSAHACRLKGCN